MADNSLRDELTAIWAQDAIEANDRHPGEAAAHLLDAAGSIIVHAQKTHGLDARQLALNGAQYLIDQVAAATRPGAEHG
jgi:hypothetical protein